MGISPLELGLPIHGWRDGQYEGILNSLASQRRFVAQNAPTGSGKSWLLLGEAKSQQDRVLILTGTKTLEDQYVCEAKSLGILDIRGKSNYRCIATDIGGEWHVRGRDPVTVDQAPCQFGAECGLKDDGCKYYDTLRLAKTKKIVISNYAAWISANMYTEGWGYFPLIMCDEAHEAEQWLTRMLAIEFPWAYQKSLEAGIPVETNPIVWRNWANETIKPLRQKIKIELSALGRKFTKKQFERIRSLQIIERLMMRVRTIDKDWMVLQNREHVLLHPVWVHKYTEQFLFTKAKKVVLASATLRPHTIQMLGVENGQYDFFEYPSNFPACRRPIYYLPTTKMNKQNEDDISWIEVVDQFISKRLDRKGIVHTVSFSRQKQLMEQSRYSSMMIANSSSDTRTQLQRFKLSKAPSILVTPSMTMGVDLKYKDAEYTIIPKIPFENITDPLFIARSKADPDYGFYIAAQTLLQAIGRAMRAEDDQCETLITDKNFEVYMTRYRHMLPRYFWDAVQQVKELPEPLPTLIAA